METPLLELFTTINEVSQNKAPGYDFIKGQFIKEPRFRYSQFNGRSGSIDINDWQKFVYNDTM